MRGLLSSVSYFALRTPDGVGGGASTAPDNAGGATAGGEGTQPPASAPAPAEGNGGAPPAPVAAEAAPAAPVVAAELAAPVAEPAKPEPQAPSLIESAKGKEPAADGAAKPAAEGEKPAETPAKAGEETKAAEPGKEAAKEPSADTGAGDTKAADKASEVKPPEPLKYEAFKVPDQVKLADDRVKAFTDIVGPAQVKQEVAQSLLDLHVNEIQRVYDDAAKAQRDHWNVLNDGWKSETRKDEEIGGNRLETSLSMAKAFVETYAKEGDAPIILAHMSNNGMGNFLPVIRLFHNAARALNVFEDSIVPAASAPTQRSKEPGQRGWYGAQGSERRASAG